MKRMLLVGVLGIAGFAIANANEETQVNLKDPQTFQVNNQEFLAADSVKRTAVDPADLPETIKTKLGEEEYRDWLILSAYLVEPVEKAAHYEITLHKEGEEEVRVVRFDVMGNIIPSAPKD
jgi:hypothetical protein